MYVPLDQIARIRKRLGMTQQELAKKARVSQSMIAKMESGRLDPSYTKAMAVIEALQSGEHQENVSKVMQRRVISVSPTDSVQAAIKLMRKHGISQLPVVSHGTAVGLVSESIILDAVLDEKGGVVERIMHEAPPVVSPSASVRLVSQMLSQFPLVLVAEKGVVKGLVTKSDLLARL